MNLIAKKINTICADKNVDMNELANRSGLTTEQIEIVINSESLPALAPLIKISRALGVRLGTFLDDATVNGPAVFQMDEQGKKSTYSSQLSSSNTHLSFVPLASSKADRTMEPFIIHVGGAPRQIPVSSAHEGEEFIYVLNGKIRITYGCEEYILHEGESIYYDSIVEHLVMSADGKDAKILAVVYSPF